MSDPMTLPELLVLRHGETEWNAEGRLQGRLDSPLTERGRDQAAAQRAILAGRDLSGWQVRVSPQGRAQATADIVLEGLGLTPVTEERLCEIDVGEWSGRRFDEIRADWAWLFDEAGGFDWYDHAPGGEGLGGLETRCRALLADLHTPTILICHGITSRMLRVLALGWRDAGLEAVPGGQGVAHRLRSGRHETLEAAENSGVGHPPGDPLDRRAAGD